MKCIWFDVCPMRWLEKKGKITNKWKKKYCEGDFKSCKRYQAEEKGIPHSDYLLPDGNMCCRDNKNSDI